MKEQVQTDFVLSEFHKPPQGFSYQRTKFNTKVDAIWILNHSKYSYTTETIKSIWGFYSPKTKKYYAPIDSKKVGKEVNIKDTTPYSAMQLNLNPLERCFIIPK